jgi:hypothetical protein
VVRRDDPRGEVLGVGLDGRVGAEAQRELAFRGTRRDGDDSARPEVPGSCTASEPTPLAAAWTTTVSPGRNPALPRNRCQAVSPCTSSASAAASCIAYGTGTVSAADTTARDA